ncbi:MAG: ankyrin repeat domain-containing protein [Spirochaetaceae bacterium]|jgi:ankyrin repeat protein|nr:ankyrin repeat domain-containing protein [Spirochaetaceae bacterium]
MRFGSIFFLVVISFQIFLGCQSQPVWNQLSLDDRRKAREFLQSKLDVNSLDADFQGQGRAPIHMAVDLVDDALVAFIIDLGADVHRQDREGRTPLRITWENFEKFNKLEAEQRDIAENELNWKIFRKKAAERLEQIRRDREANNKIVRLLVEAGADIHEDNSILARNALVRGGDYFFAILTPDSVKSTNSQGKTLLHLAAEMENYPVIPYITAVDNSRSIGKQDNAGKTALDLALSRLESIKAIKTAEQLFLAGAYSETPLFSYLALAVNSSDYNIISPNGDAPLHYAAAGNYRGFVEYLIEKKADVNVRNALGATPLHEAIRMGHIDIMKLLLAGGADINVRDNLGNTAMHLTAPLDWHREVLDILLTRGGNPNLRNEYGDTPLHSMIALHQDVEFIQRLLAGGADVSIRNNDGKTPLYFAVQENMVSYIAPLLSYNSDVFAADNQGITPFDRAMWNHSPTLPALITAETVSYRDQEGNTILHKAIKNHGTAELIGSIIEKGAWINARNGSGDTSLHMAIRQNEEESGKFLLSSPYALDLFNLNVVGETPVSLILNAPGGLREWALTPAAITVRDGLGNTMLHYAAQWRLNTYIPVIVKKGAAVEAKNYAGETPVFEAVKVNSPATIRTLIAQGADFSAQNNLGNTPLHTAIRWNTLTAADALIKAGADINAPNGLNQKTPLHDAVRFGMPGFVRLLIENGADVEARDNEGATPFIEAIRSGVTGIVELLVAAGVDPRIRDVRGDTPLHIAIAMDRFDLVVLLLDLGSDIHAKNIRGESPFLIALKNPGSPHILRNLLVKDRIEMVDENGRSPLHIAIQQGASLSLLGLIFERGGKTAALDGEGRTPLRLAVDLEAWDTARFLVHNGSDIFAPAKDGRIPAYLVLDKGPSAIRALFSGMVINARNHTGDTILHYAARYNGAGEETVRLLLELGANKNIRNQNGKIPLQIARDAGRPIGIIRLLD